ncbi:unnamed protein product [Mytilus edulis]|uniref:Uncharacterized protein n=1 Tax=Mytilus edulis TaxID=6550 RepID=A0A8S3RJJ4_MYTED|nr:unnamed protein product [Mytilus edulis]
MEEKAQKGVKGLGKGLSAAENAAGVVEGVAQLSGAEDVADVAGQLGDGADIGVDAADIGSGCFKCFSRRKAQRTAINSLLRQYSVLKQNNSRVSFKKFQTNQNRTFHQLSRDFRFLSSLLTKCGFHREATLAKEVAGHVRCFSTTGARLDKTDSDKDKQENDADKEKHNDEDDDKEKENERKEAMEHMWRMLIRVSAISLILFIMMSMTMPPDPAETASPYSKIYITWQEFYHDLLLKGEVDRIQVLPNGKYVHVYPHHGAMFKGEPIGFEFHLISSIKILSGQKTWRKRPKKGVKGLGKGLSAAENAAGVVEGVAQLSGAEDVADVAGQLGDGADIGVDAADIGSGCFKCFSKKKSTKVKHSDKKVDDKTGKKESDGT